MQFVIHVNTIITNPQGQILLVREKKPGAFNKLNFPGGHLEPSEGLVECAQREAKEEVSAEIHIDRLVGVFTGVGKDHYINFIFKGAITNGSAQANTKHVKSIEWHSIEEINDIPNSEILNPEKFREIIKKYKDTAAIDLSIIKELI